MDKFIKLILRQLTTFATQLTIKETTKYITKCEKRFYYKHA